MYEHAANYAMTRLHITDNLRFRPDAGGRRGTALCSSLNQQVEVMIKRHRTLTC